MNQPPDDDQAILSQCLSGNDKAAEKLVLRFSGTVYRTIQYTLISRRIRFNSEDLEDLHSLVFLQLFDHGAKKLRQYEGRNGCGLHTWMRVVVVRMVLNHLRENGVDALIRPKKMFSLEDVPELQYGKSNPLNELERKEQEILVQEGIGQLRPRDRLFLKLHYDRGLSLGEVADIMDVSVRNIHTVKHRAIQRLRSYLMKGEEGS